MAKFIVYLTTTASTSVKVDAEDSEDAVEKAYDAGLPTICAQCSGWGSGVGLDLSDVWEVSEVEEWEG